MDVIPVGLGRLSAHRPEGEGGACCRQPAAQVTAGQLASGQRQPTVSGHTTVNNNNDDDDDDDDDNDEAEHQHKRANNVNKNR